MADQTLKDIDRAFKALEERNELLDKIRAEIEQMNNIDYVEPVTVDEVLQIIDKYREEQE